MFSTAVIELVCSSCRIYDYRTSESVVSVITTRVPQARVFR